MILNNVSIDLLGISSAEAFKLVKEVEEYLGELDLTMDLFEFFGTVILHEAGKEELLKLVTKIIEGPTDPTDQVCVLGDKPA